LGTLANQFRERWAYVLLALLPMAGFWFTGLFDLDEGFYGAVVSEMNRRGEWITPYYAGQPWFEKPILLYWLAKPSLMFFGEFVGPRLPSVFCSLGTLWIIRKFAEKHFGEDAGQVAPLVLGSCLLFAIPGQLMMTDPVLLLCLTGAFLGFWDSMSAPNQRWKFGLWLGLSVLAKGPVGVLLWIPIAIWVYAALPEKRAGFKGGWLLALVVFSLAVASWYLPAYLINRDQFVQKFLIEQNLQRFTGGDEAHTWKNPLAYLYFIPVILLGAGPWLFYAYRKRGESDETERYLAAYAIIIFLFFSLSGAKLVHYVMPCLPPIAILAAVRLSKSTKSINLPVFGTLTVVTLISLIGLPIYYRLSGQQEAHTLIRNFTGARDIVALYQIGRREASKGTGGTQLRETSMPSLRMYLNGDARDVETLEDLLQLPSPIQVFTRRNRITPEDEVKILDRGFLLSDLPTPDNSNFRAFTLSKRNAILDLESARKTSPVTPNQPK
jgi:4-amino-4-deoxy-L-arabinose transferase-like glycosyltransferase